MIDSAPSLVQKRLGLLFSSRRFWRTVSLVILAPLFWSVFAWAAARRLIVEAPLDRADAIIVLSGSAALRERVTLAAKLYQQGKAKRIILTNDNDKGGWSVAQQRNLFFYERATEQLRALEVPNEEIEVLYQPVSNTHDEAVLLRQYAEAHGLGSLLFVTSAYHSRRALSTIRDIFQGSNVRVGLEHVPPGLQTPSPATWWWYPQGWQVIAGEYAKSTYYWLRNWI
jgi:uncharacterized SAM-binding protein YcdF (DUF218 family)